jgi:ADP-heptose:LPS heptosyltransferase
MTHTESPVPALDSMDHIVVFRALQLGDMLCAVPALRALRGAAPHARITLIGLPWAREFAERYRSYLDDFMAFPGFPGLPECVADVAALPRFLADAQRRRFDLAIQLHGSGELSNPFVGMLGARRQAGYHAAGAWCPDPATCLVWGEPEHEVTRYLRLMQWLGCTGNDAALEFPIEDAAHSNRCRRTDGMCASMPARGWRRAAGRPRGSGRLPTALPHVAGQSS